MAETHPRFRDLIGQVFGRLTVKSEVRRPNRNEIFWYCECSCGGNATTTSYRLTHGLCRSCSCLQKEWAVRKNTTHGLRHIPEYRVWASMKDRCYNPNDIQYPNYGGRGITVCEEWRDSFIQFFTDMGPRPEPDYSIDRRDNSMSYSKSNCLWVDEKTQQRNRRNNNRITFRGETYCATEWEERQNLPKGILWDRITRDGWSIERALTEPVHRQPSLIATPNPCGR